ncbi:MAG: hypothetical protein AAGB00_03975, partial [Planctomycetota bacterium]
MSRIASFCDWLLRSPLIWGILGWVLFDNLVRRFGGELLNSYFTETWIHATTTAVFSVGMAALAIRGLGVMGQFGVLRRPLIDPIPAGGQPTTEAATLVEQIERRTESIQKTYLAARLKSLLEYVSKSQSADKVESQLQSLEEADYER